jgi:hypothetical protein
MKRLILLVVALAFVIPLALGCGDDAGAKKTTTPATKPGEAPKGGAPAPGGEKKP